MRWNRSLSCCADASILSEKMSIRAASFIIASYCVLMTLAREATSSRLRPADKDRIQAFVHHTMRCRHVPGLTIAVVSARDELFVRGFGHADLKNGRTVDANTLFPIASTTKAFTVTLLAMLLQKSRYTWDTPIRDILGNDFKLHNDILTRYTTIRDILVHRTGIPGHFVSLLAGIAGNTTREELVRRLRFHKPRYEPRTHFIYNNYMYMLAGYVSERLADDTWEQLVRERIFKPLAMTSSKFTPELDDDDEIASPYVFRSGRLQKVDRVVLHQVDLVGPAGSIMSNANDMAKWLQFHLRNGRSASGEQLINYQLLKETYEEQMALPSSLSRRDMLRSTFPVSDVAIAYDLGWMTNVYRGHRRVWHSGGISTYRTQVWLYPHDDFAVFSSVNGPASANTTTALILIHQFVSDLLLGETPWSNRTTACTFPLPWKQVPVKQTTARRDDRATRQLTDYVGVYRHPAFGNVSIAKNSTSKRLGLKMGRFLEATLFYDSDTDTFHGQLTGKYWHHMHRIPVKFRQSGPDADLDTLRMPLSYPLSENEVVVFTRVGGTTGCGSGSCVNSQLCVSGADSAMNRQWHCLVIVSTTIVASRWLRYVA